MPIPLMPLHRLSPGGKTKLLMSFGGRDAFQFVCWLRLALYQALGFTKTNHIYLDTYGLMDVDGSKLVLNVTGTDGSFERGAIELDLGTRAVAKKETTDAVLANARGGSVGTMNSRWNERYQQAMREARVMLFVVTPAWLASEFCRLEFTQFTNEWKVRRGTGAQPLASMALCFEDDPASRRRFEELLAASGLGSRAEMRIVSLKREWAVKGSVRESLAPNMRDLFTLTERSFQELLLWLPPTRRDG